MNILVEDLMKLTNDISDAESTIDNIIAEYGSTEDGDNMRAAWYAFNDAFSDFKDKYAALGGIEDRI